MTRRPHDGRVQIIPTDQLPEGITSPDTEPRLFFTALTTRGKASHHLVDLDPSERKATCKDSDLPPFRIDQLSRHYFTHFTRNSTDMTDLPAAQRKQLRAKLLPELITLVRALRADGGRTIKHLWKPHDGMHVESILVRYKERIVLCVSPQAGYGMACPLCVTGQMDLARNLSTREIVEQARHAAQASTVGELTGGPARLSNVVFMDTDGPTINYKDVVGALRRLIDPALGGLGLSARGIIVSTAGPVSLVRRLADEEPPVALIISLHTPNGELRNKLIPVDSKQEVGELLDAAHDYFLAISWHVSIEYVFIKDMNDHAWHAQLFTNEPNRRDTGWAHANPIPLNPTPGSTWTCSGVTVQDIFVSTLRRAGVATIARDTRGSDIGGTCGQLAIEVLNQGRVKTT